MDYQTIQIFVLGLIILGCIVSSKLSTRVSMPGLLLFLLIGMGLRLLCVRTGTMSIEETGFTWEAANSVGVVALAFILYSGGYDSSWKDIKSVLRTGTILASAGVLICALLLGVFAFAISCRFFPGERRFLFFLCMLFASLISSTDASAVFSILRSKSVGLKGNLKPLLELESGSNDPMATFLTLFFLNLCIFQSTGNLGRELLLFLPSFGWKMIAGAFIGYYSGKGAIWLFNHIKLDYDGLYYVLGTAVVLLTYSIASLLYANGFMAVYIAGVCMGNHKFIFSNGFGRFANALGWLMQVLLFTILGFMSNPLLVWRYRLYAILVAAFLMIVARPVATFLCMGWQGYSLRAKTLVSWVGLRGGAPIMLATFPMLYADKFMLEMSDGQILNMADIMFNVIFCMVLISVGLQSYTIMPLARRLGLDADLKSVPRAPLSFDMVPTSNQDQAQKGKEKKAEDDYENNRPAEFTIDANSDLDGKQIRDLKLPAGVFVLMVRRGTKYLVPRGNTVVHSGDCLSVLATPVHLEEAEIFFRSTDRGEGKNA